MKNYLQPGKTVTLPAPRALASGGGALIGATFGVATGALANGEVGEFLIDGVVTLPKATGAINPGALVYWDNTDFNVTTTSTDNTKIGVCVASAALASGATEVNVRLNGAF